MKPVRRRGTAAEVKVRKLLRAMNVNYGKNVGDLPGSPGIVHRGKRKAIFVHECSRHHHAICGRDTIPKRNDGSWSEKLLRDRERDQEKVDALLALGFEVLVVWECELAHVTALSKRLDRFWDHADPPAAEVEPPHEPLGEEVRDAREEFTLDVERWTIARSVTLRSGVVVPSELPAGEPVSDRDLGAAYDLEWLRQSSRPWYEKRRKGHVRIADLFSGCGGMSIGLIEAARSIGRSAEVAFAADFDTDALDVFQENLDPRQVESGPIERVLDGGFGDPATDRELELIERVGKVDVLLGGPPCQGHSNLNNHTRRDDPKNELYARMARFAELFEPDLVIIENVTGVRHDKGGVFERTRRRLDELEYKVDDGILRGDLIGVPQTRHRVFLVASKTHQPSLEEIHRQYGVPRRSFDWACRDLWLRNRNGPMSTATEAQPHTQANIDFLHEANEWELPNERRPDCHRLKPDHSYKAVYGRIRGERPAPTITTGFTVMGQGRFVHPYERRTLNPGEGARLQFFPDWFDFGERNRKAYLRLIGNAVPPKMAYVLGLELLR
jgi:DNA (cytosine-5)-methyltransferase 1